MKVMNRLVAVAMTAALAGCGGGSSSSLGGPSRLPEPGATIRGTVQGAATSSSSSVVAFSHQPLTVRVVGTGISTTTNNSGQFVLEDVPSGTVTLEFTGDGVNARLEIAGLLPGQELVITVSLSGSDAALMEDDSDSDSDGPAGDEIEFDGTVTSLNPLVIDGETVVVDGDTRIDRADCDISVAELMLNDFVEVEGVRQADGSVLARELEVKVEEIEIDGVIESITATSIVVDGRTIALNDCTKFRRDGQEITMADLVLGDEVEVDAIVLADGTLLARRVSVGHDDDDEDSDEDGDEDGD